MSLGFLLILVALFYNVAPWDQPSIVHISPNQTTTPGNSVRFNCSVSSGKLFRTSWAKLDPSDDSNPTYVTASENVVVLDPRVSVAYDNVSSSYLMELSKVGREDAGVYACQIVIQPDNRVISAKTMLTVKEK